MVIWIFFLSIYGIIYYKSKLIPIIFSFAILALFINNFSSQEIKTNYNSFFHNAKIILVKTYKKYNVIKDKKLYDEIKADKTKIISFESGSGHSSLYANAIYLWEDSKILGTGYKNFYNKCTEKDLTRCTNHPHNFYLDVLVSTGLSGFLLLIVYLTTIILKIIYSLKINSRNKNAKQNEKLLIVVISFFMHFFPLKSAGSFFTTSNSTYMMIILVLLISQLNHINLKKINNIF